MFSKFIRYGAFGTVALFGANYTLETHFKNEKESFGLIRFGRAAFTVTYF